jgi:adenylyltransferase/sulfurtransferase
LIAFDVWTSRFRVVDTLDARREDCLACGQRRFEFLRGQRGDATASLCGRNAVQIRGEQAIDLPAIAPRLARVGSVERTAYFLRCRLSENSEIVLTLFPDGRAIIQGTQDQGRARSLYARYIGS